jgi:NADPH:quinone reductase-like Zn-dependent oxidoreductase
VQLLSVFGARVTAVCATEYVDLVGSLGAHRVIDYTAVDFTRDDETFDVVIDAVGKSSFGACRRLLSPRGAYLSTELGRGAQNPLLALTTPALRGRRVLFPIPHHSQTLVQRLRSLLEAGRFRPLVDRHYPLDRIVDAHRYAESGRKIGSVVIDVRSSGSPAAGIPAAN